MRMGVGLIAVGPVLLFAGWLFNALGLVEALDVLGDEGEWMLVLLLVPVVWIILVIWWAMRAPAQVPEEDRPRYLAFLRHAQYRVTSDTDSDTPTKNR